MLATHGSAETLAYIPRCDHAVVLIHASTTSILDDLLILRRLYEAAIPASALPSKADLLSDADSDYTRIVEELPQIPDNDD